MGKKDTESHHKDPRDMVNLEDIKYERDISRLSFLDANKAPEVVSLDETEHRVNYFIGNDETNWRTDIQTSRAVLYKEVYRNIDLKVYGVEKEIEYDWVVRPGGNVEEIGFEYSGVKGTRIDGEGNLVVETEFGDVMHRRPDSYQLTEGERREVEVDFREEGENM